LAGGILGLIAGFLAISLWPVDTFSTGLAALGLIPVLAIVAPIQNQTVSGPVDFFVQADSSGLMSLQFKIDGHDFGAAITGGSCRTHWDSIKAGDGLHTIQAAGIDQFGNTTMSPPVTVLVNNHAMPSPPAPPPPPTPTPTPTPTQTPTPTPTPTPSPSPEPALRITRPPEGSTVTATLEAAVMLAAEMAPSGVRLEIRQPNGELALTSRIPVQISSNLLVFKPLLRTLDDGPYDLVAVRGTLSSPPVRVNFVRSFRLPRSKPVPIGAPTPSIARPRPDPSAKPSFTLTLQTTSGPQFRLTSTLTKNGVVLPGVLVTFVVTGPAGPRQTLWAKTDSEGVATVRGWVPVWEPRGVYQVVATAAATGSGAQVSVAGSFVY